MNIEQFLCCLVMQSLKCFVEKWETVLIIHLNINSLYFIWNLGCCANVLVVQSKKKWIDQCVCSAVVQSNTHFSSQREYRLSKDLSALRQLVCSLYIQENNLWKSGCLCLHMSQYRHSFMFMFCVSKVALQMKRAFFITEKNRFTYDSSLLLLWKEENSVAHKDSD